MNEKIMDMQQEMKDSAGKVWLAGLGALTVATDEGGKLFRSLVERGQEYEGSEKPAVETVKKTVEGVKEKAGDVWARLEDGFNDKVGIALQKLGVPTRDEIHELTSRVDQLMEAINKLNATDEAPAEKAE